MITHPVEKNTSQTPCFARPGNRKAIDYQSVAIDVLDGFMDRDFQSAVLIEFQKPDDENFVILLPKLERRQND